MNKIKLSVKERIIFPGILPENGRKVEMILCNDLLSKAQFSPEEIFQLKLRDSGNGVINWDTKEEREIEIELSDDQITFLKNISNKIDEDGKATRYNASLLEKISLL